MNVDSLYVTHRNNQEVFISKLNPATGVAAYGMNLSALYSITIHLFSLRSKLDFGNIYDRAQIPKWKSNGTTIYENRIKRINKYWV